jgi:hypothetical protein
MEQGVLQSMISLIAGGIMASITIRKTWTIRFVLTHAVSARDSNPSEWVWLLELNCIDAGKQRRDIKPGPMMLGNVCEVE